MVNISRLIGDLGDFGGWFMIGFTHIRINYPLVTLVNVYITMENHHVFFMGKLTISMVMFNSFLLALPEGKSH